jgi:multicomponent K+:H+ antiporter subunit D
MTKVGAYAILRVETLIFGDEAGLVAHLIEPVLMPLALLTVLIAGLGVVSARSLRRQVADLVVLSVGTLLIAFALGTQAGIAAGLYYLAHSTLAAAALFLLTDIIAAGRGAMRDRLDPAPPVPSAPLVGGLFFLLAVLIAGLPPLSGFLGKWMLLQAATDSDYMPWVFAVVLGVGLLTIFALARSGSLLFYRSNAPDLSGAGAAASYVSDPESDGSGWRQRLTAVVGLAGLCLILVIAAGPVSRFTADTADALLTPQRYIQAVLPAGEGG